MSKPRPREPTIDLSVNPHSTPPMYCVVWFFSSGRWMDDSTEWGNRLFLPGHDTYSTYSAFPFRLPISLGIPSLYLLRSCVLGSIVLSKDRSVPEILRRDINSGPESALGEFCFIQRRKGGTRIPLDRLQSLKIGNFVSHPPSLSSVSLTLSETNPSSVSYHYCPESCIVQGSFRPGGLISGLMLLSHIPFSFIEPRKSRIQIPTY